MNAELKRQREELRKQRADEQQVKWDKQVIKICPGWTLKRSDAMNWAIIRKGHEDRPWFYGRLLHALRDIPHKLLNEGDKKTFAAIETHMEEILKIIDRLDLKFLKEMQEDGEEVSI